MPENNIITSIIPISANTLKPQQFSPKDDAIIPSFNIESGFNPESSKIELFIYDLNNNLIISKYDFRNWRTTSNSSIEGSSLMSKIEIDPTTDAENYGIDTGKVNLIYNFINYHLLSTPFSKYFISDISSDRTELRLKTNKLGNDLISNTFDNFQNDVLDSDYFDEFYLNFGDNKYIIGVNAQLDTTTDETAILIKLYEPLPSQYGIKDQSYIVTKLAESVGYQVSFEDTIQDFDTSISLRGPNTNLNIKKQVNNSTEYKDYNTIFDINLSSSFYRVKQLTNKKGININVDYSSSFSNFVYFSSAEQRLKNFNYKAELIESYQSKSDAIENYINTPPSQISSSAGIYKTKIEDIIKNFDGYEYFLYYNSESKAWPKQNSTEPYILYSVSSSNAKNWLGNSNENSSYYGGRLYTASTYDNENQNNLVFTTPEYIREDSDNSQYDLFINMMGQHFDNLWLYTKNITNKLDRDNRLTDGVSKDLVADVLRSLGTKIYGGGFAVEDLYTALLGYNTSGSLSPPTGSEYITNYITASGDPVPFNDAKKELYKRLYNNLPYLLKKKGTVEGIKNLITIYGIPDTILRVSEFGGKDKQNSNDYDYSYDRFSYALKTRNSASVLIPWKPLKNSLASYVDIGYWDKYYTGGSPDSGSGADTPDGFSLPNSIQFRFKTPGIPNNNRYSQSIFVVKNPTLENTLASSSFNFGVFLNYTASVNVSESYSGSIVSPYNKYGYLELVISESTGYKSSSPIYLPFYDGGWWSGMLTRNLPSGSATGTYTLHAGNNIYNGADGDKIGFYDNTSLTSGDKNFWRTYSSSSVDDGLWFGGHISGSTIPTRILHPAGMIFSGSLQELRYSSALLSSGIFKDFVMNPESIEGTSLEGSNIDNNELSSFNAIGFRAPLGNELFELTSSNTSYHSHSLTSMHPAVTASSPSQIVPSFIYSGSGGFTSSSLYRVIWQDNNPTGSYADKHTETYYLDQPVAGLKNRITDKIKIRSNTAYGNTLSNQISIEQYTPISESYIRDVNQLEVAFSPQNEINDDIIQTYGYFNIGEFIGDPRFVSSSDRTYPDLDRLQRDYFKKYYKNYSIYDYVRLIRYFDNSLFKMIKDYVPARTSLNTGIVIKQHILERNRQRPAQVSYIQPIYSQSISMETFSGGAGGSVNKYNTSSFSQSFSQSIHGISGSVTSIHSSQEEFYTGEYSGSRITVTTQSLNVGNIYLDSPTPLNVASFSMTFDNVATSGPIIILTAADGTTEQFIATTSGINGKRDSEGFIRVNTTLGVGVATAVVFRDAIMDTAGDGDSKLAGKMVVTFEGGATVKVRQVVPAGGNTVIINHNWDDLLTDTTPKSFSGGSGIPFELSDYNVTLNNAMDNVEDDLIQVVNYTQDASFPYNYDLITGSNALKAQIPKSFFTQKSNINPRYDGCELKSLDYNTYTSTGSFTSSFNNDLFPNYKGDISYGETAVIDKHPKYFAHFKHSFFPLSKYNSLEVTLDYLIPADAEVPSNISNIGQIPGILQVKGDGIYQYITSNNFEHNRKSSIDFNIPVSGSDSSRINWGNLENNSWEVIQGGSEFTGLTSNQLVALPGSQSGEDFISALQFTRDNYNFFPTQNASATTDFPFFITGTLGSDSITFRGDEIDYEHPSGTTTSTYGLAQVFSDNYRKYLFPTLLKGQPWWYWNPQGYGFEETLIPPFPKIGDYLRLLATGSHPGEIDPYFKPTEFLITNISSPSPNNMTIHVYPEPISMSIFCGLSGPTAAQFTLVRKTDQDNKVTLSIPYLKNTNGINSLSSTGFLIPDDFTQDQKDKTANIITILKGNNLV